MTQSEHTGSSDRPGADRAPRQKAKQARLRRRFRRAAMALQDAAIGVLALVAVAAPFALPAAAPQTALAISLANPLMEHAHQRAQRSVVVSPERIQTLWPGSDEARAQRSRTPLWVRAELDMPGRLSALEALGRRPVTIEVREPRWTAASTAADASPGPIDATGAAAARRLASAPRPSVSETLIAGLPGVGPTALDVVLSSIELSAPPVGPTALAAYAPPVPPQGASFDLGAPLEAGAAFDPAQSLIPRPMRRPSPDGVVVGPQERAAPVGAQPDAPADAGRAPEISIVLTAVGLNQDASVLASAILPPEIAFAVPPIAPNAAQLVAEASSAGRVALLEAPLQSDEFPRVNAAPLTLLAGAEPEQNAERLAKALSVAPGVDGVATYLGDRFVRDPRALEGFARELERRGLFLLASDPETAPAVGAAAQRVGARSFAAGVALDDDGRSADLTARLAALEAAARESGRAIGVAVAVPASVSALADWASGLEARGVRLAPITP